MKWKNWLFREPFGRFSARYRRIGESIVSAKTIVIVLGMVFIPSTLVALLGVIAVYRVDRTLQEWVRRPAENILFQLEQKLTKEWDHRLSRYAARLEEEEGLHRELIDLLETDERVVDVILYDSGDFRRVEPESPFRVLDTPVENPALRKAWELEFQRRDPVAALRAYREIFDDAPPELEAAALLGEARVLAMLGKTRESTGVLTKLADRHGHVDDGSGVPWGLSALRRVVTIHQENRDLVAAGRVARRLARFLRESGPWLDDGLVRTYREFLESYRRAAGDFDLVIGLSEIRSPISTLILEETDRQRLRRHARSLGPDDDRGYHSMRKAAGSQVSLAFFGSPNSDRVIYLVLDPGPFLGDVRLFTRELQVPDALLRAGGGSEGRRRRPGETPEPLVTRAFPTPFQGRQMEYYPAPEQIPRQLQNLETFEVMGFIWALIVLVLTIFLGVMITVRSILREMQISRLKTDFVSFVTHELKTPLTAIRMFTETLLMDRARDRQDELKCIELIDKEASRLSRLIGQILEFSRIETQQQVFNFTTCDMSEVLAEAVRIFKDQNQDEGVDIVVNQAQNMSKIRLDRSAMVELLLNLLSNAHKYSRDSGGKIVVNLKESIDDIFVEVIDFGIGIPKSEQRKIFDKFYRAQDYLTRDVEGTGLGLTFAKYIARVHNGEIKVSSAVDHGSTFTLELRKNQILAE